MLKKTNLLKAKYDQRQSCTQPEGVVKQILFLKNETSPHTKPIRFKFEFLQIICFI